MGLKTRIGLTSDVKVPMFGPRTPLTDVLDHTSVHAVRMTGSFPVIPEVLYVGVL